MSPNYTIVLSLEDPGSADPVKANACGAASPPSVSSGFIQQKRSGQNDKNELAPCLPTVALMGEWEHKKALSSIDSAEYSQSEYQRI
ncbi:hypothetical protein EYF80_021962 [Liparis tanakae]|uniref:Uncharacterized protein n=1 Tax=Liparis tanakae TaxID=230148 RepID=A0A4Z2HPR8_9TELE|nr:hypothetical protein EYF80_021962 [Liparis tanakae]